MLQKIFRNHQPHRQQDTGLLQGKMQMQRQQHPQDTAHLPQGMVNKRFCLCHTIDRYYNGKQGAPQKMKCPHNYVMAKNQGSKQPQKIV